jgi:hypothetical protein
LASDLDDEFDMLRPALICFCIVVMASFVPGCPARNERASHPSSVAIKVANAAQVSTAANAEFDDMVFQVRYYRERRPCIQIGNGMGMPLVDVFQILRKIKGERRPDRLIVRLHSGHGPSYPEDLTDGKKLTLRLTPSARTIEQLRDYDLEIVVGGDEIEEVHEGESANFR